MFGLWLASIKRIGLVVLQKVQNWIKAKTKPARMVKKPHLEGARG